MSCRDGAKADYYRKRADKLAFLLSQACRKLEGMQLSALEADWTLARITKLKHDLAESLEKLDSPAGEKE